MSPIEREYHELLKSRSLIPSQPRRGQQELRAFIRTLNEKERRYAHAEISRLRRRSYRVPGLLDIAVTQIRNTLRSSGIDLNTSVHVGEYPHAEFNARALATDSGVLILINTGLSTLLDRVGLALGASTRFFTRDDKGGVLVDNSEGDVDHCRVSSTAMFAESVVAYLSAGRVPLPPRANIPIGDHLAIAASIATSALKFSIAHEFGHVLAGHVHESSRHNRISGWGEASLHREYEADELALMLLMRESAVESHERQGMAIAGPFVFMAVDHLMKGVQQELFDLPLELITGTHPPSIARAAALRELVKELSHPSLLQLAESFSSWISSQSGSVVQVAQRRLEFT